MLIFDSFHGGSTVARTPCFIIVFLFLCLVVFLVPPCSTLALLLSRGLSHAALQFCVSPEFVLGCFFISVEHAPLPALRSYESTEARAGRRCSRCVCFNTASEEACRNGHRPQPFSPEQLAPVDLRRARWGGAISAAESSLLSAAPSSSSTRALLQVILSLLEESCCRGLLGRAARGASSRRSALVGSTKLR